MRKTLAHGCALVASVLFTASLAAQGSDNRDLPAVEIDGQTLTMRDIERQVPGALFKAYDSFYDAQRKAIDLFVDDYLLRREAEREQITVAELLDRHVNSTIAKDPSDESLRVYYEGLDTAEPFESAREKIIEHLRQRRIAKAKTEYLKSLHAHASIGVKLTPPRIQLSLKGTPLRGPSDAAVVLVEYADYECPYCQQMQPALDRLETEYKGRVAFAYKDMPLPMHSHAQKAAEATHCAEAQGKYWEYRDLLSTSKRLDIPSLREQARALKLDGQAFDRCLDAGESVAIVNTHLKEAQTLGLDGTPSFFLNGRFFSGVMSYDALRALVEEELARPRQ